MPNRGFQLLSLLLIGVLVFEVLSIEDTNFWLLGGHLVFSAAVAHAIYFLALRRDPYRLDYAFFLVAYLFSLVGAFSKLLISSQFYDAGDFFSYFQAGRDISHRDPILYFWTYLPTRTEAVEFLSGLTHFLFQSDLASQFVVFSFASFLGSVFYFMGSCWGPGFERRRFYRYLIFLMPSMVYWPSSPGKDSVVLFGMGAFFLGFSKSVAGMSSFSSFLMMAGILTVSWIRPHVAVVMLCVSALSSTIPYALLKRRLNLAGVLVLVLIGSISTIVFQNFLAFTDAQGLESFDVRSVETFFQAVSARNLGGGSSFVVSLSLGILGIPYLIFSGLFRPFPWEVHNVLAGLTALESASWLVLCYWNRNRLIKKVRNALSEPVYLYALLMTLVMSASLFSLSNFGLVARQRVQFLPLFFMLFS